MDMNTFADFDKRWALEQILCMPSILELKEDEKKEYEAKLQEMSPAQVEDEYRKILRAVEAAGRN